jgi:hypothetical protein
MRCRKNDYLFADYGAAALWAGDMYECELCKARVVVGIAREPVAYEPFDTSRANFSLTRAVASWSEDRIERHVERMTDHLDRVFLSGQISQKQYDDGVRELDAWARAKSGQLRARADSFSAPRGDNGGLL